MELIHDSPTTLRVDEFLDGVAHWNAARWRETLAHARRSFCLERREMAIALRDAIIASERLVFAGWRATDGSRTVIQMLPATLRHDELEHIAELVREAALALAARPALPLPELAVLLGPFLPLQLATTNASTSRRALGS